MSNYKPIRAYESRADGFVVAAKTVDTLSKLGVEFNHWEYDALVPVSTKPDFKDGLVAGIQEALAYIKREASSSKARAIRPELAEVGLKGILATLTGNFDDEDVANGDIQAFVNKYFEDRVGAVPTLEASLLTDAISNFVSESKLVYFSNKIAKVNF